jgi:hypothetical protein
VVEGHCLPIYVGFESVIFIGKIGKFVILHSVSSKSSIRESLWDKINVIKYSTSIQAGGMRPP